MGQIVLHAENQGYEKLEEWLGSKCARRIFLVHGNSLAGLSIAARLRKLWRSAGVEIVSFTGFHPNPEMESVTEGIRLFRDASCDVIAAVGGGSAMDVAKCIRIYRNADLSRPCIGQETDGDEIPLLAVPTTAGTGSEVTRYAVIYQNGEKQSIAHEKCLPDLVLLDPDALQGLPGYQRKATMLDALCHGIESFWSVHADEESWKISIAAIRGILAHRDGYLMDLPEGNRGMLHAAHLAGKAINFTQTTAGHAMSYKISTLYGIAHGHAAALCVDVLWPWMLEHLGSCIDQRGEAYLGKQFSRLAELFHAESRQAGAMRYREFLEGLRLPSPQILKEDIPLLAGTVNPVRLKNHPIALDESSLLELYEEIRKRSCLQDASR